MKVAINARIEQASSGGVESVLIALLSALGELDSEDEYKVVGLREGSEWLESCLRSGQTFVREPKFRSPWRWLPMPIRSVGRAVRHMLRRVLGEPPNKPPTVPVSSGFLESLGVDVIHFPFQQYTVTDLPSVYNPHDLQHRHFPDFFPPDTVEWREVIYGTGCREANVVVAGSQWVKEDILRSYGVSPDKIQVIPWAPPTVVHDNPGEQALASAKREYGLDRPFALYPARTWKHKNHMRLIEALASLRDKGREVPLVVCTGGKSDYWPTLEKGIASHGLQDHLRFTGYIPGDRLRALYSLAQFVFVPTLFEAASGPLFEAWLEGTPAACSTVTSLPEQAGNAALLFNPLSVDEIAGALERMSSDEALRDDLREKGRRRLEDFSWERTARAYRAVYRRAAGLELTEEETDLLAWDWMKNPRRETRT